MSEHFVTFEQIERKVTKKTVKIELAHCPFCGGEAEFRIGGNYNRKLDRRMGVGVRCKECKAMTPVREGSECPEVRAAKQWNNRTSA
jgi:Lar family restriction alleviation protein